MQRLSNVRERRYPEQMNHDFVEIDGGNKHPTLQRFSDKLHLGLANLRRPRTTEPHVVGV